MSKQPKKQFVWSKIINFAKKMQYDLKNNVICHSMFDEKELVAKKKKLSIIKFQEIFF